MDGVHHEEEIDSPEQVNVAETSATRSYDCMYCKRGFSTAQALGGHMNIHRRDRGRVQDNVAPPSSTPVFTGNVHAAEEEFGHSGYSFGSFSHKDLKPLFPLMSEPSRSHPLQSSCTTSPTKEERRHGKHDVDPEKMKELIRYGKELGLGCKHVDVEQEKKERQSEKGNLDLHLGL